MRLSNIRMNIGFLSLGFAILAATAAPAWSQTPSPTTTQSQTPPQTKPSDPTDASTPTPDPSVDRVPLPKPDPTDASDAPTPKDGKAAKNSKNAKVDATGKPKTDSIPSPGEDLNPHIKAGSEDDVNAIGTRNIGGRGLGNWYSTDWEIRVGKQYSMEIEKSAHLVTDPVIVEYVNRVGQNLVKNSDAKVPFTIKVIDSDEINAMALPGGFFYVNSGLILNCDEEAELAGVMAHEISHVIAHHAARQQTKMNYTQIGMTGGSPGASVRLSSSTSCSSRRRNVARAGGRGALGGGGGAASGRTSASARLSSALSSSVWGVACVPAAGRGGRSLRRTIVSHMGRVR